MNMKLNKIILFVFVLVVLSNIVIAGFKEEAEEFVSYVENADHVKALESLNKMRDNYGEENADRINDLARILNAAVFERAIEIKQECDRAEDKEICLFKNARVYLQEYCPACTSGNIECKLCEEMKKDEEQNQQASGIVEENVIEPSRREDQPQEKRDDGPNWEAMGVMLFIISGVVTWFITRRKKRKIGKLMHEVDNAYSKFKMNTKRCEAELYRLKDIIDEQFKKGKLDEGSYNILEKRISDYMREIREQIINEKFGGLPTKLHGEIDKMLEDGKISKEEYENIKKVLKDTTGVKEGEKEEIRELIDKWKRKD